MRNFFKVISISVCMSMVVLGALAYFWIKLEKSVPSTLLPPQSYWVRVDKPLREQVRIVEIAGIRLQIPKIYIDSQPDPGENQSGILLEVIWPDMQSIYDLKNKKEYEQVWKRERKLGWILIEAPEKKTPFNELIDNMRSGLDKEEALGKEYGLEKFIFQRGVAGATLNVFRKEIYLKKDSQKKITTFIECPVKTEFIKTPTCEEGFLKDQLYYKIIYNKDAFLSQWRQQEQRTIDFVNGFKISQSSK